MWFVHNSFNSAAVTIKVSHDHLQTGTHNIRTISKHLLEKSEAICCLLCSGLIRNVIRSHTNTPSQGLPLPSLTHDAESCRQGDLTWPQPPAGWHGLTVPHPQHHWLRGPDVGRCVGSISDRGCLRGSAAQRSPAMNWQSVCWRFIISRLQTERWPPWPDRWSHLATWLNTCPRGASAHILSHHYFIPSRSISERCPDLGGKNQVVVESYVCVCHNNWKCQNQKKTQTDMQSSLPTWVLNLHPHILYWAVKFTGSSRKEHQHRAQKSQTVLIPQPPPPPAFFHRRGWTAALRIPREGDLVVILAEIQCIKSRVDS